MSLHFKNSFVVIFLQFILITSASNQFHAQKTAVSNMSQNIMYLNKDNELHIIRESTPCQSLKVTTDNGKISYLGQCKYNYVPARPGLSQIVVRSKSGDYNYLVRVVEAKFSAEIYVGNCYPGIIRKNDFVNQLGIIIKENGQIPHNPYTVLSFSCMIIRENKIIKNYAMKGPKFSNELKEELNKMMAHDHIIIYNVVVEDHNNMTMYLQPAEFIIK